jgi:excisionase family DNA binding protein
MADKFADWPTKFDVADTLGLSLRSIERLIKEEKIRVTHRRIPGRKALTICDPKDIEDIKATVLPVMPAPENGTKALAKVPARANLSDVFQLFTTAMPRVPLEKKLYLTVKEGSEYSGLPQTYLRRLIKEGKLKALSAGGYRVRRADLEKL